MTAPNCDLSLPEPADFNAEGGSLVDPASFGGSWSWGPISVDVAVTKAGDQWKADIYGYVLGVRVSHDTIYSGGGEHFFVTEQSLKLLKAKAVFQIYFGGVRRVDLVCAKFCEWLGTWKCLDHDPVEGIIKW